MYIWLTIILAFHLEKKFVELVSSLSSYMNTSETSNPMIKGQCLVFALTLMFYFVRVNNFFALKYQDDLYTEQNYKCNTFVFTPIFHELNSNIEDFFYVHKRPISLKYCSQICLNLC